MTERKPVHLDWDPFAEQQIRDAQEAGAFKNLPGFGKPIPGIDDPHDDWWWIKQKVRRENISILPPALQLRADVEKELTRIWTLSSEPEVRSAVTNLNERIRDANFSCLWGPPSTTMPLDVEQVVLRWKEKHL